MRRRSLHWKEMDGLLVLDKPAGWTSHDAVNKVRRLAATTKVGHLGTLDPLATGVLPLVIGRATRLAQFFGKSRKSYDAVIRFGQATDTYDADGEPVGEPQTPGFDRSAIEGWIESLRGDLMQTPPSVSAKKVNGTPAYKLARKKIAVELAAVPVTVFRFEITAFALPDVAVSVECSAGTYIRSLAHELGLRAGCGAHLAKLVRTRSGDFTLDQALTMDQLRVLAEQARLEEVLIPASDLLPEFPAEPVDEITASQIRQGRDFRVSPFRDRGDAQYVRAIGPDGRFVALGEVTVPNVYHPVLVF